MERGTRSHSSGGLRVAARLPAKSDSLRWLAVWLALAVPLAGRQALSEEVSQEAPEVPAGSTVQLGEPGPYGVGIRRLSLVDESRHDPLTDGPRKLVTEIWYPIDPAEGAATNDGGESSQATFTEFFAPHRETARKVVEYFGDGDLEAVERRFRSRGVRDAPLRKGSYPLLIFSHGNGGLRHQSVFQMDHLASHGYVVASPDHTGNAAVTPHEERAVEYDRRGRERSAKNRPLDVSFLITQLLEGAAKEDSWSEGCLDGDRVGVLGHSFGGYTACRVAETDRRVRAILPMTVAYGKPVSVPVLVFLAGRDRTVGVAGNAVSYSYWMSASGPKYFVNLRRGGHFSFSDMDLIDPAFGDGAWWPSQAAEAGEEAEFLDARRAKRIINHYTLAFFDRHLRGDLSREAVLVHSVDEDEVLVEVAPSSQDAAEKSPAPAEPHRVLIVTGDDVPKHDWRATTAQTRAFLDAHERIETFVSEDPSILESSQLSKYDTIVLNFRNPPPRDPGDRARRHLEQYVREGGGLVVLHFALYAFPTWDSYRELLGRVWVGRVTGKKISAHPPRGTFAVRVVDASHPVSAGLDDFEADDELFSKLQGSGKIRTLLSARSPLTDADEPVAWVREFGEGRVFACILGHDTRARELPAFRRLVTQAVLWTAD